MAQVVDVETRPILASTNNRPKYAEVKDTPEAMGGSGRAEEQRRRGKKKERE